MRKVICKVYGNSEWESNSSILRQVYLQTLNKRQQWRWQQTREKDFAQSEKKKIHGVSHQTVNIIDIMIHDSVSQDIHYI